MELSLIYSAIGGDTTWGGRYLAIVTTFLDTGLRRSELAELKVDDVHLEEGRLKVMGKGRKERIAPLGNSARRTLIRYFYHFRSHPFPGEENRFFLTIEGEALTSNAVRLVVDRLAKRSGVKRLHAHLFRHTFAVRFLMNGGNVFSLQQILGHTSLEMVKRYCQFGRSVCYFGAPEIFTGRRIEYQAIADWASQNEGQQEDSVVKFFPETSVWR